MKNIVYTKLVNKIKATKDIELVTFTLIAFAVLFYIGWELGRSYAGM